MKAVRENPYTLEFVPMDLNKKKCNEALKKGPCSLTYVPDCYVRLHEILCEYSSNVVAPER